MQFQATRSSHVLLATAMLVAVAPAAPKVRAGCGEQHDFMVRADPLLGSVRPADCATLLGGPPQFTWPLRKGRHAYTVALRFPDGHTETRTTKRNWLSWDRAVPAGEYTWRVSVSGRPRARSEPRAFRMERVDPPGAPARLASSDDPRRRDAAPVAASAANLFRLEPAETWIPSASAPKGARKPSVGGFFGGFME